MNISWLGQTAQDTEMKTSSPGVVVCNSEGPVQGGHGVDFGERILQLLQIILLKQKHTSLSLAWPQVHIILITMPSMKGLNLLMARTWYETDNSLDSQRRSDTLVCVYNLLHFTS